MDENHSVNVTMRLSGGGLGTDVERPQMLKLGDQLTDIIEGADLGTVDGHGFGDGAAEMFLYGRDAEKLFAAIEARLREFNPAAGSTALLVFGSDHDAATRTVQLS